MKRAILFLGGLLAAAPVWGATLHVPGDYASIAEALAASADGDSVLVDCGVYFEHNLNPHADIVLRGTGASPDCVVIDAQQLGRGVVTMDHGVSIENLTVRNGVAGSRGGGIESTHNLVLRDVVVEGCHAYSYGGGVFGIGLSFDGLELRNNDANYGGGIYLQEFSGTSRGLLATGNEALDGSAFYVQYCDWTLEARLEELTLVGNRSTAGGGALTMAPMDGEWPNWLVIRRAIFAGNEGYALSCPDDWGDFYQYTDPGDEIFDAFVSSSCFWNNSLGDFGGDIDDLTGSYGNLFVDPLFCTPELGNYALREDSPCLPDGNLCRVTMGAVAEPCVLTDVESSEGAPAAFRAGSFPNPFNPSTQIRFTLPRAERVTLRIFDIAGRRVATLLDGARREAGEQNLVWDGRDDAGQALPSGVYLYRLEAGAQRATRKLTLLK